jgi:hypothetical protein
MAKKCSWCNGYISDQYWIHYVNVGGKQKKSEQKFCSPKCSYEYPYQATPEKSGCFVATAVYGDYNHPVILDLRYFRDNFLNQKKWGRSFISWYYTHSPNWANIIRRNHVLRALALLLIIKPLHLFVKWIMKNK